MRLSGPLLGFSGLALGVFALAAGVGLADCNVYDSSLVEGKGASTGAHHSSTNGAGGEGGGAATCTTPATCPGMDTACGTRTCNNGVCDVDAAPVGTVLPDTHAGDCKRDICDGSGDASTEADPADLPNDNRECTDDTCNGDQPVFTDSTLGNPCTEGGGFFCKAGACVECIDGTSCTSGICTMQGTCAPATCNDSMINGGESDVDCGGPCDKCANDLMCNGPSDCISSSCAGTCQPSCTDLEQDQNESDIDCGGVCAPCAVGLGCDVPEDCESGVCDGLSACGEYVLKISEARFHGPGAGTDDFVEIYNPLDTDVVLTNQITLDGRSLPGASYSNKWTGSGQILPAHGHFLTAGAGYSGTVAPDFQLGGGMGLFGDKASAVLHRGTTAIDALCIYCGTSVLFDGTYTCEGTPYNLVGCTSSVADRSLERTPGGAAGSGNDSNDNTADFVLIMPPAPQNLASAPAP